MKIYFIVLAMFASTSAFAGTEYTCKSVDENAPYAITEVGLKMEKSGNAVATFYQNGSAEEMVTEHYQNNGVHGGNGKMKDYLDLEVSNPHYDKYGEGPINTIFAEQALASGGYTLHNGKKGGYIAMTGSGYSYARFICMK